MSIRGLRIDAILPGGEVVSLASVATAVLGREGRAPSSWRDTAGSVTVELLVNDNFITRGDSGIYSTEDFRGAHLELCADSVAGSSEAFFTGVISDVQMSPRQQGTDRSISIVAYDINDQLGSSLQEVSDPSIVLEQVNFESLSLDGVTASPVGLAQIGSVTYVLASDGDLYAWGSETARRDTSRDVDLSTSNAVALASDRSLLLYVLTYNHIDTGLTAALAFSTGSVFTRASANDLVVPEPIKDLAWASFEFSEGLSPQLVYVANNNSLRLSDGSTLSDKVDNHDPQTGAYFAQDGEDSFVFGGNSTTRHILKRNGTSAPFTRDSSSDWTVTDHEWLRFGSADDDNVFRPNDAFFAKNRWWIPGNTAGYLLLCYTGNPGRRQSARDISLGSDLGDIIVYAYWMGYGSEIYCLIETRSRDDVTTYRLGKPDAGDTVRLADTIEIPEGVFFGFVSTGSTLQAAKTLHPGARSQGGTTAPPISVRNGSSIPVGSEFTYPLEDSLWNAQHLTASFSSRSVNQVILGSLYGSYLRYFPALYVSEDSAFVRFHRSSDGGVETRFTLDVWEDAIDFEHHWIPMGVWVEGSRKLVVCYRNSHNAKDKPQWRAWNSSIDLGSAWGSSGTAEFQDSTVMCVWRSFLVQYVASANELRFTPLAGGSPDATRTISVDSSTTYLGLESDGVFIYAFASTECHVYRVSDRERVLSEEFAHDVSTADFAGVAYSPGDSVMYIGKKDGDVLAYSKAGFSTAPSRSSQFDVSLQRNQGRASGIAAAPDNLYICYSDHNRIDVYARSDSESQEVIPDLFGGTVQGFSGIEVQGDYLYLSNSSNGDVYCIDRIFRTRVESRDIIGQVSDPSLDIALYGDRFALLTTDSVDVYRGVEVTTISRPAESSAHRWRAIAEQAAQTSLEFPSIPSRDLPEASISGEVREVLRRIEDSEPGRAPSGVLVPHGHWLLNKAENKPHDLTRDAAALIVSDDNVGATAVTVPRRSEESALVTTAWRVVDSRGRVYSYLDSTAARVWGVKEREVATYGDTEYTAELAQWMGRRWNKPFPVLTLTLDTFFENASVSSAIVFARPHTPVFVDYLPDGAVTRSALSWIVLQRSYSINTVKGGGVSFRASFVLVPPYQLGIGWELGRGQIAIELSENSTLVSEKY